MTGTAETPQIIPVDVIQLPIDSTGTPQYDGEALLSWPFGNPAPYTRGRFQFGVDPDQTDTNVDVMLRNYDTSTNITSTDSLTSDTDFETEAFDPEDIGPSETVGVRCNVDSASSTSGAEWQIKAWIVLKP